MYIDTHSKKSMEQSICDYFNISIIKLDNLFSEARRADKIEDYQEKSKIVIGEFIYTNLPDTPIDEILFFHLGRRLNDTDSYIGNNLFNLLSQDNCMTDFFKKHDIIFSPCEDRLNLIHDGKLELFEDTMKQYNSYLKWRLGYTDQKDFCFNGLSFKDLLYRNTYARSLFRGPEFIQRLSDFLERPEILNDYFKSSTYYCYEYQVPIEKVIFDGSDKLLLEEKYKHFLKIVFNRLYEYSNDRHMTNPDNPILRLADDDIMLEEYFVSKEEITSEMLNPIYNKY